MLYLPAFSFEKQEIRLPAIVNDVVALTSFCGAAEISDNQADRIFSSSPGLLLYAAAMYRRRCDANNFPIDVSRDLSVWAQDFVFESAIEPAAFEPFVADEIQRQQWVKWQLRPGRKRLTKFLVSVTELTPGQSRRLVKRLFGKAFNYPAASEEASRVRRNPGSSASQLPIRQLWLVTSKLRKLERDFEEQLLRQKMDAMKQLAYGASHEINNPLANIATRAQSLMSEEPNRSRRQRLSVIYAQAIRAHEMISDMMLFAHPPDPAFESHDAVVVIEGIVGELHEELKNANVTVRIRRYPDVPVCEIDSTQIAVGIKAMIQNAVIAIGNGGEIRIQIWRTSESNIAISISDDGQGIDDDTANKIFDPFFSGREAGRGLGFGLSKAWRIVELHNGCLSLDTDSKRGARFVISLPIKQRPRQKSVSRIDNMRAA